MSFDVNKVIDELKKANPNGFILESHLQVEFGYAIKRAYPKAEIVFEYPFVMKGHNKRMDIRATIKGEKDENIGFEFKYFTKEQELELKEYFIVPLKNQVCKDLHRIGFWKDIEKMEHVIKQNLIEEGYCILLTNDVTIFNPVKATNNDKDYDISKGLKPGKKHLTYSGKPQHDVLLSKIDYSLDHSPYSQDLEIMCVPVK